MICRARSLSTFPYLTGLLPASITSTVGSRFAAARTAFLTQVHVGQAATDGLLEHVHHVFRAGGDLARGHAHVHPLGGEVALADDSADGLGPFLLDQFQWGRHLCSIPFYLSIGGVLKSGG